MFTSQSQVKIFQIRHQPQKRFSIRDKLLSQSASTLRHYDSCWWTSSWLWSGILPSQWPHFWIQIICYFRINSIHSHNIIRTLESSSHFRKPCIPYQYSSQSSPNTFCQYHYFFLSPKFISRSQHLPWRWPKYFSRWSSSWRSQLIFSLTFCLPNQQTHMSSLQQSWPCSPSVLPSIWSGILVWTSSITLSSLHKFTTALG